MKQPLTAEEKAADEIAAISSGGIRFHALQLSHCEEKAPPGSGPLEGQTPFRDFAWGNIWSYLIRFLTGFAVATAAIMAGYWVVNGFLTGRT
jgi:hypothetical protein